jgi:hypothetical protein
MNATTWFTIGFVNGCAVTLSLLMLAASLAK